ncbi:MAG: caspase family protein, partial [Spirochaetaceae bacterium]|nr:caspase family protein [Spirochaetaceae bacterium]
MKKAALFVLLSCALLPVFGAEADILPVERFALYVASNQGGNGRSTLKYAGTDAYKLENAMRELGGVSAGNSMVLVDPKRGDLERAFASFNTRVENVKDSSKRTEFLFYYSGHSDEYDLILGNDKYSYPELKQTLSAVPADVHVVMLDSCFSGSFIRVKGGSQQKPFLMDDSAVVKGHAYLSSSSESEASQESDSIQASYFTHALVTGLRGAADSSSDGKVSLNELYHYAYNETLARTEFSMAGPQHPSYNYTLVGSGDLVMTDIAAGDAAIVLDSVQAGKFFVRTTDGTLVAEVNKVFGTTMALALPAGKYAVSCVTDGWTAQTIIQLKSGERFLLERSDFTEIIPESTRRRGADDGVIVAEEVPAEEPEDAEVEEKHLFFYIGLFNPVSFPWGGNYSSNIALSLLYGKNHDITGLQGNYFMGRITGDLLGVQGSAFMSIIDGRVRGLQGSGFMNIANGDGILGVQGAGFMNINKGYIHGLQGAGFMNITSGEIRGVQGAGFMNINNGGFVGIQGAGFMNIAKGDGGGIQGAGFMNINNGAFAGIQSAGFMNIMKGHGKGIQAAGFLNIADEFSGLQLGIINIADELHGAPIGLFNFIKGGIMSPAVYVDNQQNLYLQYQGGTNWFYTTWFVGAPWDFQFDQLVYGAGIGARLQLGRMLSFDFEILSKQYVNLAEVKESFENGATYQWKDVNAQVPGARVALNLSFAKH